MSKAKLARWCGYKKSQAYKGVRRPACMGGKGCMECWRKYIDLQFSLLEQVQGGVPFDLVVANGFGGGPGVRAAA